MATKCISTRSPEPERSSTPALFSGGSHRPRADREPSAEWGGCLGSRRDMVLTLAASGTTGWHQSLAGALATDLQSGITPVAFRVPARACDCHVHVFGDPSRFPFSPDRVYTPPPAPVAA